VTTIQSATAPARWPTAATAGAVWDDPVFRHAALGALACLIFLQRVAVEIGGALIPAGFPATLLAVGLLALTGRARVAGLRLMLFLGFGLLACTSAFRGEEVSMPSLAYALALYPVFVFTVRMDAPSHLKLMDAYQKIMLVVSVLAVAQFAGQFVHPGVDLFLWAPHLPFLDRLHALTRIGLLEEYASLTGQAYNTLNPLGYGTALFKSNGFFLLEPSLLSQFAALAVIIELSCFAARSRILFYLAAMLVAYSGTGPMLLAVFGWIFLWRFNRRILLLGMLGAFLLAAMAGPLRLDAFLARAGELTSTTSSGFARFVSPFWLIGDFQLERLGTLLFGFGPGAIDLYTAAVPYGAHDPTWGKVIFEYGFVGAAVFFAFIAACLFAATRSRPVAAALFISYLALGGYFLSPYQCLLVFVLGALASRPDVRARPA
jgi:hypothetical protein